MHSSSATHFEHNSSGLAGIKVKKEVVSVNEGQQQLQQRDNPSRFNNNNASSSNPNSSSAPNQNRNSSISVASSAAIQQQQPYHVLSHLQPHPQLVSYARIDSQHNHQTPGGHENNNSFMGTPTAHHMMQQAQFVNVSGLATPDGGASAIGSNVPSGPLTPSGTQFAQGTYTYTAAASRTTAIQKNSAQDAQASITIAPGQQHAIPASKTTKMQQNSATAAQPRFGATAVSTATAVQQNSISAAGSMGQQQAAADSTTTARQQISRSAPGSSREQHATPSRNKKGAPLKPFFECKSEQTQRTKRDEVLQMLEEISKILYDMDSKKYSFKF